MYVGSCPICNNPVFLNDKIHTEPTGYVYQGKIKRYFHLSCLDSIKRGNTNVKEEQI